MKERKLLPISKVDPSDTKIELNCRPIRAILIYLEEKYGRQKMEEFIYDTKMNLEYLENGHNWISYDYFCRLLAKLVEYTGNPRAPFMAGLYTTREGCYGAFERFYTRLGTPGATYKLTADFTTRYCKIDKFEISKLKKSNCVIKIRMLGEYKQDKNNCLNLQGIFASVPGFWKLPPAKVKEVQCAAEGADSCVYEISWRNKPSRLFGLTGMLAGLIAVCFAQIFTKTEGSQAVLMLVPVLGYLFGRNHDHKIALAESVNTNKRGNEDLERSFETIEKMNIDLQAKIEQRTEELRSSNEKLKSAMKDLEEAQDQLIRSERLASVGHLAAGMAHELNNPVGAIRSYIQDVMEEIEPEDSKWKRLKMAEKATGRCKRIVMDLLTFSRENKDLKVNDINEIVEKTISVALEEISNPRIKMTRDLSGDLPKVKGDSRQIQQVFMNIIMNASAAIANDGEITIKTYSGPENVSIEVTDNGEGIPEDIQGKIFDPFFTTKSPGRGTGLGLAISYNIIKRFNGDIRVKSALGKGTVFTIVLPVSGDEL
ncbi:MAG: ATP-binding protein [Candidatus Omnitrophota bacterium]|jgi:signal transduction histidine kinase